MTFQQVFHGEIKKPLAAARAVPPSHQAHTATAQRLTQQRSSKSCSCYSGLNFHKGRRHDVLQKPMIWNRGRSPLSCTCLHPSRFYLGFFQGIAAIQVTLILTRSFSLKRFRFRLLPSSWREGTGFPGPLTAPPPAHKCGPGARNREGWVKRYRHTYSRRLCGAVFVRLGLPGWSRGCRAFPVVAGRWRGWVHDQPPPERERRFHSPGGRPLPAGTQAREENPASPHRESGGGAVGRKEEEKSSESGRLPTSGELRRGPGTRPPAALRSLAALGFLSPRPGHGGQTWPSAAGSPRRPHRDTEHSSRGGCADFCESCRPHPCLPWRRQEVSGPARGSDPSGKAEPQPGLGPAP